MDKINSELANSIDNATYVSFDIFDTAVLRNVLVPVDVFTLVQKQYSTDRGNYLADYQSKRIQAERRARKKLWQRQISEVSLDEIFSRLGEDCGWDEKRLEAIKNLEIETEIKICRCNRFIFEVYRYCLSQQKRVVFTSDMYLPRTAIEKILQKAGYEEFEKIFLSSEVRRTKHKGDLYLYMRDRLGCKSEEILHIGDNHHSDVVMAQKNGIKTYYYQRTLTRALGDRAFKSEQFAFNATRRKTIEESIYFATIVNRYYDRPIAKQNDSNENCFWYDLGFKNLGVLFLSFSAWLREETQQNGIEKIFFLSRDGYIMKRVYDLFARVDNRAPKAEYLYASRRALNIPGIVELDEVALKFLLGGTSILKVSQFLERAGLQASRYQEQLQQVGLSDLNEKIIAPWQFQKLKNFYQLIANDIKEVADLEREKLAKYLESLGFFNSQKVAVVDIGWHGSMQYSLSRIVRALGKKVEIEGYYVATKAGAKKFQQKGMKMSSYLCDCDRPLYHKNTIRLSTEIFEFIHSAPHGSVIKYVETDRAIEPILEDNDRTESELDKVQLMHTGALDFIEEYLVNFQNFSCLKIPEKDIAVKPFRRILKKPTLEEAQKLGDIEHVESFGKVDNKRYIAKPPKYNFLMLLRLDKVFISLKSSFWKMGYIRRFLARS
jgi:predicted HAD superfamily hydrolase